MPTKPFAVERYAPQTWRAFTWVILLTGLSAGLCGLFLSYLLHFIQHIAYGYSLDRVISHTSFLQGVSAANPWRRLWVLMLCGLVAGLGWWALLRWGKPLVSIKKALAENPQASPPMPIHSTFWHGILQIISVALGSPLGREVAPREWGAACAGWFAARFNLAQADRRILLACGAGAGLAAVYNVPLAGALFTLEVLLASFALRALLPAMASSTLAAMVVWLGFGNEHQYHLPAWPPGGIDAQVILWALFCGPIFGCAAWGFTAVMTKARAHAPKDSRIIWQALLSFSFLGVLVMFFPQLPGNGKGAANLAFHGDLTLILAATLLFLKPLVCALSLRVGSEGGLLTPALACGALLAVLLGSGWNQVVPSLAFASLGALAIVGACAFLAASMQMPLTALVLVIELTRVDYDFLVPMLCALVGSMAAYRGLELFSEQRRAKC